MNKLIQLLQGVPDYLLGVGFILLGLCVYIVPGLLIHHFISSIFKRSELRLGAVSALLLSVSALLISAAFMFAFMLYLSEYSFSLGLFLICYLGLILFSAIALYFANYLVENNHEASKKISQDTHR